MESLQQPQRRARRITGKRGGVSKTRAVAIEEEAYVQLTQLTKKLKLNKSQFVSAAVTYFAATGLNPAAERVTGLANVREHITKETDVLVEQNTDIGNRLIAIMKTWEKQLYGFMQQQEAGLIAYLGDIEANVLRHQVEVESKLLTPLLERLFRNGIEGHMTRVNAERVLLQLVGVPEASWPEQIQGSNVERDQELVREIRAFVATNKLTEPTLLRWSRLGAQKQDVYFCCHDRKKEQVHAG